MRKIRIAPGEYYHVLNRGVNKQTIFHDANDYTRFLFLILYFQSPITFANIIRCVQYFVQHSVLNIEAGDLKEIIKKRTVELVSFCFMPNHFHLIIKEVDEGGIAAYMQRVLNSYTKYYNTKYEKSGHLFQGPYKAVHVGDDRQLLYLSTYVHRNPRELSKWKNREHQYPWSSYQDFVTENRWGELIQPDIVSGRFKQKSDYKEFVESSPAKLIEEELGEVLNI